MVFLSHSKKLQDLFARRKNRRYREQEGQETGKNYVALGKLNDWKENLTTQ